MKKLFKGKFGANKISYPQKKEKKYEKKRWYNFFSKWFFEGLICICLSIIITVCINPQHIVLKSIISIISGIFSTVGIALMLGAIFDFTKNSITFTNIICDILTEVVISKTFLETLAAEEKENVLKSILKPTDYQIEKYSNIEAFFKKRVSEWEKMFDINFKSNVVLNIIAYEDIDQGKVFCKTDLTQTIYKFGDKFKPIEVIFEKEGSISQDVYILPPDGEEKKIDGEESKLKSGGIDCTKYTYQIPEEFEQYDRLTIKRIMIEPGNRNWINYYWQSLTPYESLNCTITCEGSLSIKDYMIFDNKAYYHVTGDENHLRITSSQWLNADTGFTATIGTI